MARPEKKFKVGGCTASVFANQVNTIAGKALIKSVSLQKTFKNKDGNFQSNSTFGANDLPKAILALSKAYEYLVLEENEVVEANKAEPQE